MAFNFGGDFGSGGFGSSSSFGTSSSIFGGGTTSFGGTSSFGGSGFGTSSFGGSDFNFGSKLQIASSTAKDTKSSVLEAVKFYGDDLQYASDRLKNDQEVVSAAVKQNGGALQYASARLKLERAIVLEAVKQNGVALQYAADKIKNDKDIVLEAVRQSGGSLQFASAELKNDKDVVLAALKSGRNLFSLGGTFKYASDLLKGDRDLALVAVREDGYALEYVPDRLKDDRTIVSEAVKNYSGAIAFASISLKDDKNILLEAVKGGGHYLKHASDRLKDDDDVVLKAVKQNACAMEFASDRIWGDQQLLSTAVSNLKNKSVFSWNDVVEKLLLLTFQLQRIDDSPFLDTIDFGNTQVKICKELMKMRFPQSCEYSLFDTCGVTLPGFTIIKKYAYYDRLLYNGENVTILDLLAVYRWTLAVNAPQRFLKLLLNHVIQNVNANNCLSVYHYCNKVNLPEFDQLRDHCLAIIWKMSIDGRVREIDDIADNTVVLLEALTKERPLLVKVDIPSSTYLEDLTKLFDSEDATTKMVLSKEKVVGVVPAILTSASDYFKSLLSFDLKDGSVELLVDLSHEEYEELSDEDKSTRANALYKILEYCHTGKTDVTEHAYMIWHFTCYIGLDKLKSKCEQQIITSLTVGNVMHMAKQFPVEDANNHDLRKAIIKYMYTNWENIKRADKPHDLMKYLSPELMSELLVKFSK
jgi:hypothetical protein